MSVASKFLRRVWKEQPREGTRFLSAKDWGAGTWTDHPQKVGNIIIPTYDDLYFAPNVFSANRRRKSRTLPGRWLFADLDEVDPKRIPKPLRPTIAWQTSPDRYQALWLLENLLRVTSLDILNQKLTYYLGADKGGWGTTKVLRVPGTRNNKRDEPVRVKLLWDDGPEYKAADVWELVRGVETPSSPGRPLPSLELPRRPAKEIREEIYPSLGLRAKKLLKASEVWEGEDRSDRLWELERLLIEAGVSAEETFVLVRETVWNKYAGQGREARMLWSEICRAKDQAEKPKKREKPKRNKVHNEPVDLTDFLDMTYEKPQWMIEEMWSDQAHGLIVGPAKTFKSIIAMDMAISVATGTPFLNHFTVPQKGPAVYLQHENTDAEVQDRFQRICYARGFWGRSLLPEFPRENLKVWNNPDLDLAKPEDLEQLVEKVIEPIRPKLLILDPFYMLAPNTDENSASEVVPILRALLDIKREYGCGTLLIHHFAKPAENRKGMARASGSSTFDRWYESALMVERPDMESDMVKLIPTHRGQPSGKSIRVTFELEGDLGYSVDIEGTKQEARSEFDLIRETVKQAGGSIKFPVLCDETGIKSDKMRRLLENTSGVVMERVGRVNYVKTKERQ